MAEELVEVKVEPNDNDDSDYEEQLIRMQDQQEALLATATVTALPTTTTTTATPTVKVEDELIIKKKKILKYKRTKSDQLQFYVNFVKLHPELELTKPNSQAGAKRVQKRWDELAKKLNSMEGPTRSSAKWKMSLSHWRNQVRSRARKARLLKQQEPANFNCGNDMNPLGRIALDSFGAIAVKSLSDLPVSADVKNSVESNFALPNHTQNQKMKFAVEEFALNDNEFDETEINCQTVNVENPTPSSSSSGIEEKQQKFSTDLMCKKVIELLEKRDERDRQFQEESLKIQNTIVEALHKVGDGLEAIASALLYSQTSGMNLFENIANAKRNK